VLVPRQFLSCPRQYFPSAMIPSCPRAANPIIGTRPDMDRVQSRATALLRTGAIRGVVNGVDRKVLLMSFR
jgi:hypothetical protein